MLIYGCTKKVFKGGVCRSRKHGAEVKLSNLKQEGMQVRSNNEECACWTHGHGTTKISKQCNLQPSSTSVRQLTWRSRTYFFCVGGFVTTTHHEGSSHDEERTRCLICPGAMPLLWMEAGWRLPTTIGHTGEISLYSVLSLA